MRQKKNVRGQFAKKPSGKRKSRYVNVHVEHNYCVGSVCDQEECKNTDCRDNSHLILGKNVDREGWKMGRRLVEFQVLLQELSVCKGCRLGPVPLTLYNVVGEMKKGLGGYLYVVCQNAECGHINCVPYGKTYHEKKCGMPCFAANTKLGTAMIDSVGGPVRVNNLLSTLNIKPISNRNLKCMERRAGSKIETVASKSTRQAAADAFQMEMEDVRHNESLESEKNMDGFIDDIGVCPLPDTSPGFKSRILSKSTIENDDEWTDDEHDNGPDTVESSLPSSSLGNCDLTPRNARYLTACAPLKKKISDRPFATARRKIRLSPKYPCKTRSGMSCAVDTAWQKRGFDSLTSHTFFMSKAKYGKKVVKTIVSHRSCGTCQWWRRNRPGQPIRKHRFVHNHSGSARLMESVSGERGVTELIAEGTPVEYLEGDGDNTLIARLKSNLNLNMKKRFDRNHIVKNIGKSLYSLRAEKGIKLSKIVINHVQKCLKYAFAKHQGDKVGLEENLRAIIPHQFGDHCLCLPRFCGYKRKPGDVYRHKSLPYKGPLKDDQLRLRLEKIFQPITANAEKYSDLGSSQQCEHANREVTLRAPKSLHYGNSESLDFRVHATSAFINEGRSYIAQANTEAGLSPGIHTIKYAVKCMQHRKKTVDKAGLPSSKRRRLILKQERVVTQGAQEALEGVSYQSGIGLERDVDVEQLPEAVPHGNFKSVSSSCLQGEPTFITIDLETTDLIRAGQMPHITQLSAMEPSTGATFDQYVIPKVPIASTAQQVTGIVVNGLHMTVNGSHVEAVSIHMAIEKFFKWLKKYKNVFLVAHNGRRFDFPILISALKHIGCENQFFTSVPGLMDSMPIFKKAFPGLLSYKQEDLVLRLLKTRYEAHNAVEDVRSLGNLLLFTNFSSKDLLGFSFLPKSVYNSILFNIQKVKNIKTLHVLVAGGVCKLATAENIAGSGIQLGHLRTIYNRDGEDGLYNTFTAKNSEGLPRITNCKRILETVIPKLVQYFKNHDK